MSDEKGCMWVRVRCIVVKHLLCEGCTKEEAMRDPFAFAVEETEADQEDWEVLDVAPD